MSTLHLTNKWHSLFHATNYLFDRGLFLPGIHSFQTNDNDGIVVSHCMRKRRHEERVAWDVISCIFLFLPFLWFSGTQPRKTDRLSFTLIIYIQITLNRDSHSLTRSPSSSHLHECLNEDGVDAAAVMHVTRMTTMSYMCCLYRRRISGWRSRTIPSSHNQKDKSHHHLCSIYSQ